MKRYFALSRTTHGILDLAAPGFAALLWLGAFPRWEILLLSLFAAFAAYTAVYALNDLAGIAVDRQKFAGGINPGYSVEASELRYPLARGALGIREGWLWCGVWFALALLASYFLNPAIVLLLIGAAVLEIAYCALLQVTYLRALVSGIVKSCGPLAAVLAVDPHPALPSLLLVFAWMFFWEIGGQNVPADFNDTVEDTRVGARTIPLRFGTRKAGLIVLSALTVAVFLSLCLPLISPLPLGIPYLLASGAAGLLLLLRPGFLLFRSADGRRAAKLFDSASYYPLAQLSVIFLFVLLRP